MRRGIDSASGVRLFILGRNAIVLSTKGNFSFIGEPPYNLSMGHDSCLGRESRFDEHCGQLQIGEQSAAALASGNPLHIQRNYSESLYWNYGKNMGLVHLA